MSEVATEENEYLNKITEKTINEIRNNQEQMAKPVGAHDCTREKTNNEIILDLKKFNKLELVIKRRIILYTINKALNTTEGIEKVNIDDIIKLCSNNIGNKYLLPTKNIKILVKKGKIFFIPNRDLP